MYFGASMNGEHNLGHSEKFRLELDCGFAMQNVCFSNQLVLLEKVVFVALFT